MAKITTTNITRNLTGAQDLNGAEPDGHIHLPGTDYTPEQGGPGETGVGVVGVEDAHTTDRHPTLVLPSGNSAGRTDEGSNRVEQLENTTSRLASISGADGVPTAAGYDATDRHAAGNLYAEAESGLEEIGARQAEKPDPDAPAMNASTRSPAADSHHAAHGERSTIMKRWGFSE